MYQTWYHDTLSHFTRLITDLLPLKPNCGLPLAQFKISHADNKIKLLDKVEWKVSFQAETTTQDVPTPAHLIITRFISKPDTKV